MRKKACTIKTPTPESPRAPVFFIDVAEKNQLPVTYGYPMISLPLNVDIPFVTI